MDINSLRDYYRRLPDFKIIRLATEDTDSLSAEARSVLNEEIKSRKLNLNLDNLLEKQTAPLNYEDIESYAAIISSLPCPYCGRTNMPLNGSTVYKNIGFLVFSVYTKEFKVACPSCLERLNFKASLFSAALGWWSIPWGIINTIKALKGNYKSQKENSAVTPNPSLLEFITINRVLIEAYKNNRKELYDLIKNNNSHPKT